MKIQDPSRKEIDETILAYVNRDGRGTEFDMFDIEAAIYWFASHYHGGQWSNLYSVLSTSDYRPSPLCRSHEDESEEIQELYRLLEQVYTG